MSKSRKTEPTDAVSKDPEDELKSIESRYAKELGTIAWLKTSATISIALAPILFTLALYQVDQANSLMDQEARASAMSRGHVIYYGALFVVVLAAIIGSVVMHRTKKTHEIGFQRDAILRKTADQTQAYPDAAVPPKIEVEVKVPPIPSTVTQIHHVRWPWDKPGT